MHHSGADGRGDTVNLVAQRGVRKDRQHTGDAGGVSTARGCHRLTMAYRERPSPGRNRRFVDNPRAVQKWRSELGSNAGY
jgi:hypothetical protein